jgi:hypothetical protein
MKSGPVALCFVLVLGCGSSGGANWFDGTDFAGRGKASNQFPIDTCTHGSVTGPVLALGVFFDSYLDPTYPGNYMCDYGKNSKGINAMIWSYVASGAIAPGSYAQHDDSTGGAYVERWQVDTSCKPTGSSVRADSSTVTITTNDSTHVVGTLDASFGSEKITLPFDAPLKAPVSSVCQALKYTGGTNGPGCPTSLCLP